MSTDMRPSSLWLSQWTSRRLENWFQNSLKQLSKIQQKQVGLLLGAAVGDAAARPWLNYSAKQVNDYREAKKKEHMTASAQGGSLDRIPGYAYADSSMDPSPYFYGLTLGNVYQTETRRRDPSDRTLVPSFLKNSGTSHASTSHTPPLAFVRPTRADEEEAATYDDDDAADSPFLSLFHSFTYQLFALTVRSMSEASGTFFEGDFDELKALWVQAAMEAVPIRSPSPIDRESGIINGEASMTTDVYSEEHGTLLHSLLTLVGIPVIYPYATDDALHDAIEPLLSFLLEAPNNHHPMEKRGAVWLVLSMLLRCLQSNPDPLANIALRVAVPSVLTRFRPVECFDSPKGPSPLCALFPKDVQLRCFGVRPNECDVSVLPENLQEEFRLIREALTIFSKYSTPSARAFPDVAFSHAIEEAISLGCGPAVLTSSSRLRASGVCHRAMLVGAFLGASFGVRALPLRWLSATVDHELMVGLAVPIAQNAWNPYG